MSGLFNLLLLVCHFNDLWATTLEESVCGGNARVDVGDCGQGWKLSINVLVGRVFAGHEVDASVVTVRGSDKANI